MSDLRQRPLDDLRRIIEQLKEQMSFRRGAQEQIRDYHIDCANGDKIDIHEEVRIWVEERGFS